MIATSQLPTLSAEFGHDHDVRKAVDAIFCSASVNGQGYSRKTNTAGGVSYFVPSLRDNGSTLADALNDAMQVADVWFGPGAPPFEHLPQSGSSPPEEGKHSGMLSYLHKIKDGRHVYYFANSTDEAAETDVVVRGNLVLQSWNPDDGHITGVESTAVIEDGAPCTRVRLELAPVRSMFFVEEK